MKVLALKPLSKPVQKTVEIPGSKSYTNRALFLATLTNSPVKIINPLESDDTYAMINCLKTLGIKVLQEKNQIIVSGNITTIPNRTYNLNANLSGTTIRFILALSTVIPGTKIISGQEGLNKRPISDLVAALTQLGAKIEYLDKKGYPPLKITSSRLNPKTISIKGSISSQFVSALLMIAPLVGNFNIDVSGNQISAPYIDMTLDIMEKFGVKVINKNYKKYLIAGNQRYNLKEYLVEGDLSSAGYFLTIAVLTKSNLTLKNINPGSKQADLKLAKILENMGNKITFKKNQLTIHGKTIKPICTNMKDCPDQIQTVAILTAFAKGISKISGISSLRIKETDRVFALRKELKKMGIKTLATKNTITIYGGDPKAASIETYGDHRMAMSFAIAGTKITGIRILNPEVVNKTFPQFWTKLNSIGVKSQLVSNKNNIVLIGMRGSGKSTVARLLAQKLGKQYLEMDELIAKKAGMNITDIVAKYGWNHFRDIESEITQKIAKSSNKIISTGGGVITRPQNVNTLKENGFLIFLNASLEVLSKRAGKKIGIDPKMPALTDHKNPYAEMAQILKEREKLYRQAADKIIHVDNLIPEKVVDKISLSIKGNL